MERYPIEELSKNLLTIANKYFDVYQKLSKKDVTNNNILSNDPLQISKLLMKLGNKVLNDPDLLIKYQISFFKGQLETIESIFNSYTNHWNGAQTKQDKRFKNKIWQENSTFIWLKDAYYTYNNWVESIINDLPKDDFTALEIRRLHFIVKLFLDAIAPNNFPATNPEVINVFYETAGENFIKGLDNLFKDIEASTNSLHINNNDSSKFILGKNIAATKGKVVFQNEIMQLIHYNALTTKQYETPILIVSPFINKYYIMDLQQENSLVKWLLEQNYNVFLISWINPDESHAHNNFSDYMLNGPIAAVDYLSNNLGFNHIHTIGYCIGGTLLATALAYMKQLNDNRIKTASFFTTLIDFENAGDLSIFVDDHFINEVTKYMESIGGYVDGRDMATIFNLLRSNDMIWPYYINNYLLGKENFPFDILCWNEDSVRIPMDLHLFYLKNMYKDNLLKIPGGIVINNIPIDISKIDIPCFCIATKGDHIVPWNNAFTSAKLFSAPITFVLADSGHVAGIINHPQQNRYKYWYNEQNFNQFKESAKWLDNSNEFQGSWWPLWDQWAQKFSGNLIQVQLQEEANHNIIEDAPGSYVKIKY